MSILKSITLAASAAALVATPVAASAAPAAQALSVTNAVPQRAGVSNADDSQASGAAVGIVFGLLFIVALIFVAGGDDDSAASA